VDVERVRPAQEANVVAAEQVEALLGRLEEGVVPLFVFDAGYDPVKLQRGSKGARARSSSVCGRGCRKSASTT
jgi:hypothetical protein